ncbi:MAG TPA: hemerythrin domain-containing protein, partial [Candidatus Obscuribacter sp.]|nr:hemerythrin domain-containing protein [Candidatus Obscuribacter sp.]
AWWWHDFGFTTAPILDGLISYTVTHFQHEERQMKQHGFPGFAKHKEEHDALTKQVGEVQAKFKSGEGRLEDLLNGQTSLGQAKESLLRAELAVRKTKEEIKLLTSDSERYFAAHEK